MQADVYNLEFPSYCSEMSVGGFCFRRVEAYSQVMRLLAHRVGRHGEFDILPRTGTHQITAVVRKPGALGSSVLFPDQAATELHDVLLLVSLATLRDVFYVESSSLLPESKLVITADPRVRRWGWGVRLAMPYLRRSGGLGHHGWYDGALEEGLQCALSCVLDPEWRARYADGRFLVLANDAFRAQRYESAFVQCWIIWEHLACLLRPEVDRWPAAEKLRRVLDQHLLFEVDPAHRLPIKRLIGLRNRLVHEGQLPGSDSDLGIAEMFVELTELVVASCLGFDVLPKSAPRESGILGVMGMGSGQCFGQ